jgi:acyl carrier protein
MGLDYLEIVLHVEDAFGVRIEREDLVQTPTREQPQPVQRTRVGDLYELILEKRKALDLPRGKVKPEAFAMRDVRLALAEVLHMSPEEFRPGDPLGRLMPREDRRKLWRRLRRKLEGGCGYLLPDGPAFRFARWAVFLLTAAGSGGAFYTLGMTCQEGPIWQLTVTWGMLGGLSLLIGGLAAGPVRFFWPGIRVPKEARTVESLAKTHLARRRRYYIDECGGTDSDDDVWHTLQIILVDVLGVEIDEVTEEADLVQDLGAD